MKDTIIKLLETLLSDQKGVQVCIEISSEESLA